MHLAPPGYHDAGAWPLEAVGQLDIKDKAWAFWERRTHAVVWRLLARKLLTLDELRRAVEQLPEDEAARSYYEKWAAASVAVCLERGVLSRAEVDAALGPEVTEEQPRFNPGDLVRVLAEDAPVRWRRPHLRTPGYIFGLVGTVDSGCLGAFKDPERGAFREAGPRVPLYRVRFSQGDVWEGYPGDTADSISMEIYQPWLEPATSEDLDRQRARAAAARAALRGGPGADCTSHPEAPGDAAAAPPGDAAVHNPLIHHHFHDQRHHHYPTETHSHGSHGHSHSHGDAHGHSHSHTHSHDHSHAHEHGAHGHTHAHSHGEGEEPHIHEAREQVEAAAVSKEGDDGDRSRLPEVLYRLLVDKGIVTAAEVTAEMEGLDAREASGNGARLVARAWVDPGFKARLLQDAMSACAELDVPTAPVGPLPPRGSGGNPAAPPPLPGAAERAGAGLGVAKDGTQLAVVANEPGVHNLVVCTLCSCYPIALLGLSPHWYRSRAYRARAVRDPRALLAEFGTALPEGTALRVHDSTADLRFLVIPERPAGTEGWDEARLARLVTRDSMIGVRRALTPAELEAAEAEAAGRGSGGSGAAVPAAAVA